MCLCVYVLFMVCVCLWRMLDLCAESTLLTMLHLDNRWRQLNICHALIDERWYLTYSSLKTSITQRTVYGLATSYRWLLLLFTSLCLHLMSPYAIVIRERESDSICEADDMQPHVTFLSIYIFSWKWRAVWVSEVATDSRWLYLITGAFDLWVRNSCLTYLHHNYINRTQHFRAHMYVLALKRIHMNRTQYFRAHIYVLALKRMFTTYTLYILHLDDYFIWWFADTQTMKKRFLNQVDCPRLSRLTWLSAWESRNKPIFRFSLNFVSWTWDLERKL